MNGKQVSHRQIPFGPQDDGGATHGMTWQPDVGKIWIDANRLEAMIRIDPKTWEVDYIVPTTRVPGLAERLHGIAYDNGFIWQVTGHQQEGPTGNGGSRTGERGGGKGGRFRRGGVPEATRFGARPGCH